MKGNDPLRSFHFNLSNITYKSRFNVAQKVSLDNYKYERKNFFYMFSPPPGQYLIL